MISKSTRQILQDYYACDSRGKQVSLEKIRKPSFIYKHISIKRRSKEGPRNVQSLGNRAEVEISPEKINRNIKSQSCSSCKIYEKPIKQFNSDLHKPQKNLKVLPFKTSSEYPNYLLSSEIKLGTKLTESHKILIINKICENLLNSFDSLFYYRYYYNEEQKTYNILPIGDSAPLSECCNSNLVIQLAYEYGGKIICPQRNCFIHCISNFFIAKEDSSVLWPSKLPENMIHTSSSTKNSINTLANLRQKLFTSNHSIFFTPKDNYSQITTHMNKLLNNKNKIY